MTIGPANDEASDVPSPPSRPGLRGDIQGLRAIAVLTVVAAHAELGLDGGYVGVDVFFVISGFLISQLLFREVERTGSVSIAGFYARRARRILPAATLVTLVTLAGSVLWTSTVQAYQVVHDAVWATFFAANIHFAAREVDYFALNEPPSPLQHYWSLSVEEQFYLVWPLLLLAALLLLRRRAPGGGLPRVPVGILLGVLTAASLVWSVAHTAADPRAAYFSTTARAWELGLGALLALTAPHLARALTPLLRSALTLGGLAGIGWACVTFGDLTPFPGYAALLPVLGSAAILLGGVEQPDRTPGTTWPSRLLALPPLRAVGDWSYSLYLWHWPVLLLPRLHQHRRLDLSTNLLLVLVAVALAAATYRWVETPMRTGRRLTTRHSTGRSIGLYPAAVVTVGAACLASSAWIHWSIGEYGEHPAVSLTEFGVADESAYRLPSDDRLALVRASVIAAEHDMAVPSDLSPDLLDLRDDVPGVGACEYDRGSRALCRRGATDATHSLVVLGDSHGRMWIPALERIARRADWATYYLVKPKCTPARVVVGEQGTDHPWDDCTDFNSWTLDRIADLHPDLVVVSTSPPLRRAGVFDDDGRQILDTGGIGRALGPGYDALFADLAPLADRTVLVSDVAAGLDDPVECLTTGHPDLGTCLFTPQWRSTYLRRVAVESARRSGVPVVDPRPWVCWQDRCPVVVGSTLTYRDLDHLSATYAAELARPLGLALGLWRLPS